MSSQNLTVRDLAGDLENWMSLLPPQLRQTSIINIAIPGSHDSFTTQITPHSDIAPDAEQILKDLIVLGPIVKDVIARWSVTQTYMGEDQLKRGIRYFDIRSATKNGTDDLYICHSLYSAPVQSCLDEINTFLNSHPQEVVFLDFQHFYGFDQIIHNRYIQSIKNTFSSKIAPNSLNLAAATLESLTKSGYQVFVIYRINGTSFWPSATFPNPWPNTVSKPNLIESLDNGLVRRKTNIPFISQCVLTPDAKYIIENVFSTLKEKCAAELENDRSNWIENQRAGSGGLNIIIADFIDLSDNRYVRDVINVNQKLFLNKY
ncbi:unnamed protein product [Psylliodes chrysocephalus]|uniref:Phosphatidylinositol-specific phospholipase C X domain-containing protein n=1 Tax=Psylliodes chrysocephalus TaxID=3402493 RepID=A0A9P0CM97_9CUCU|nr:unnamed protein product [Psylliodes chrysocephala]